MRGFPFGTFSSFNSLPFGSMTGPGAEREAPYATSPVAIEICSMRVNSPNMASSPLRAHLQWAGHYRDAEPLAV